MPSASLIALPAIAADKLGIVDREVVGEMIIMGDWCGENNNNNYYSSATSNCVVI